MDWSGIDIPFGGDLAVIALDAHGALDPRSDYLDAVLAGPTQATWDAVRPQLQRRLRDELGRGDLIARGVTLYDLDVRLGAPVAMTTRRTPAGDIVVTGVTGVHTIIATSTTPTDLGSWADPRFSVDFGLVFEYVVDLPPVTGPVSVSGLRLVRLTGIHPDSQNLVADVALFFVRIADFFTGGALLSRLLGWLEEQDWSGELEDAFGPRLDTLNATLERLAAQGHHFIEAMVGDAAELARQLGPAARAARPVLDRLPAGSQQLLLVCRAPDTSGVLEGEISWPQEQGAPISAAELAAFRRLTVTYMGNNLQTRAVRRMIGAAVPPERVASVQGHRLPVRLGKADVAPRDLDEVVAAPSATRMVVQALATRPTFNLLAGGPPGASLATVDETASFVVTDAAEDFRARVGGDHAYEVVADRFRWGPLQFDVTCIAEVNGARRTAGRLTTMWFDDGDGWCRRRFRVEDVWTDRPLEVTCRLAEGWGWPTRVVEEVTRRNWDGRVTVHPPRPIAELVRDGLLHVTVHQADGQRRTVAVAALEAAGVVARSPTDRVLLVRSGVLGDEVALNPQPLPPEEDGGWRRVGHGLEERAIIIVGGSPADGVALNPQPLPLKEIVLRGGLGAELAERGIIVVGGSPGDLVALNPQPLPPKEVADLGRAGDDLADRAIIVVGGRVGHGVVDEPAVVAPLELGGAVRRFVLKDRVVARQVDIGGIGIGAVGGGVAGGVVGGLRGTLERREGVEVAAGRAVDQAGHQVDRTVREATIVDVVADGFGDLDLTTLVDPDLFIPDVEDPEGWGTVRGIDFRVHLRA